MIHSKVWKRMCLQMMLEGPDPLADSDRGDQIRGDTGGVKFRECF